MIEEIRKKLRYVQPHDLMGAELHIKADEISYIDHNRKVVYKRVFRNDLKNIREEIRNLPVAAIKEMEAGDHQTEFILEYVSGQDVFMHLKSNPSEAEKTCAQFEDFLASWLNFSEGNDFLYSRSFDINPGNFIFDPETSEIKKIDYLSDWFPGKKEFYFYLLPFVKILEHNLVKKEFIENLINSRFKSKGLTFNRLYEDLQKNILDTYKSVT